MQLLYIDDISPTITLTYYLLFIVIHSVTLSRYSTSNVFNINDVSKLAILLQTNYNDKKNKGYKANVTGS